MSRKPQGTADVEVIDVGSFWYKRSPSGVLLGQVRKLSTLAYGAHDILLLESMVGGGNGDHPNDDQLLARLAHLTPDEWKAVRRELLGSRLWKITKRRFECPLAQLVCADVRKRVQQARNANEGRYSPTSKNQGDSDRPDTRPDTRSQKRPQASRSTERVERVDGVEKSECKTDETDPATRSVTPNSAASLNGQPSTPQADSSDKAVSSTPVVVRSQPGLSKATLALVDNRALNHVADAMRLALCQMSGRTDWPKPDSEIVLKVVQAAGNVSPTVIETELLRVATAQPKADVSGYGYLLGCVQRIFGRATA